MTQTVQNKSLKDFVQELAALVQEYETAPDATTKQSVLAELEEQAGDFSNAITKEYDAINGDIRKELGEFAKNFNFGSVEDMIAKLGFVPTKPSTTSVSTTSTATETKKKRGKDPFQKVNNYLLKEEHNGGQRDYEKGFVNGLQGMQTADWHKRKGLKADMNYFRPATKEEKEEMAAIRAAQIAAIKSPKS
jgi:hypothetical protein